MDILTAIRNGDVSIIETTRNKVRTLVGDLPEDDGLGSELATELDEAQGEADEPGKVVYVVLKIQGETL